MPDWKSALYYYRRYRKMGLAEMIGLVFGIFTFGQYIVAWAVYAEKKYTAVSLLKSSITFSFLVLTYSNCISLFTGVAFWYQAQKTAEKE